MKKEKYRPKVSTQPQQNLQDSQRLRHPKRIHAEPGQVVGSDQLSFDHVEVETVEVDVKRVEVDIDDESRECKQGDDYRSQFAR